MSPQPIASRAVEYAQRAYAIHWSVCPARKAGRFCQACDELDLAATDAEAAERLAMSRARLEQGA